jgi:tryptophan 7-halogenase
MSGERQVTSVVVVGRDVDLWLTAAAIARALGAAGVRVEAVELPSRLQPSDIVATLPPLEALHAKLGLGEAEVLLETASAFSFGQNFATGSGRPPFFHAWGSYGRPIADVEFFHVWQQARRQGLTVPLQGFCLTAVAAHNGRMLVPDQTTYAFGRTDYGYHLHTAPYAALLKSLAAAHGARLHQAQGVEVERRGGERSIAAVKLDGARQLSADLFVDASGADALLLGGALGVPLNSWGRCLAAKRVLFARIPTFTSIPPFAEVRIGPHGWTALHPTRAATGIVHACDIGSDTEDAAASAAAAAGIELADISLRTVEPGMRDVAWQGNCIGVGEAAGVLDPIHDVGIQALQLGLVHLLTLFPVGSDFSAERREYNRIMRSRCERIRDFQCALYALSPFGGPFWQRNRELQMPDTLRHKVDTFRARGHIAAMEDETFFADSWQALFTGLGILPESLPPAVGRIPPQRLREEIQAALGRIHRKVLEQPRHDDYLARTCGGSPV